MIMFADVESAVAGAAGIPIAFLIGIVSFFSPCVLPLVPGYLSFVSGVSGEDLNSGGKRGRVLLASLLFVGGFSLVFTALGASASAIGQALLDNFTGLQQAAGWIVIAMGLVFLTTLAVKPLMRWSENGNVLASAGLKVASLMSTEKRLHTRVTPGMAGAAPLGMAFAVGWTPCVGPGLGAILSLAIQEGTVVRGAALLFAFSLGFGVWFIVGGLAFRKAMGAFGAIRRHMGVLIAVGGAFMLAIGVLMVTNRWNDVIAPLRRLIVNFQPPI